MNIKIKATGVTCLVGDDYDRVYNALKQQLDESDALLFTERTPGHEYLQWELPGDGWVSLSEGDPLMVQEVRQELLKRKALISNRFGKNQDTAQRILTVPDDNYVFYKASADGQLQIRLTAWGYRYPVPIIPGPPIIIDPDKKGATEHVCIRVVSDKKPVPNQVFYINGFQHTTDSSGVYDIGELPIGYQFEIMLGDIQQTVVVQAGKGDICLDITIYTKVEVDVTKDGQPYVGAVAALSYKEHEIQLTTDENGKATVQLPIDQNNGMCSVSIEEQLQQHVLQQPLTVFTFNFESPKEEEPEQIPEEVVEEPQEEVVEEPQEEVVEEPQEEVPVESEEPERAPKNFSWLWSLLLALLILLMVVLTYILCLHLVSI